MRLQCAVRFCQLAGPRLDTPFEFLAFEQLEQGAWQSAEAMRAEDGRGRRVRITEGATMAGDLRLIPAQR